MSTDLEARLTAILDAHVQRGVVGVSLALDVPGHELLTVTSGFADKFARTPLLPDHVFRIASCTKTFIATGLHLLVEDGKVDFDEPIARWFPDLPGAHQLPVRILLNHRSGLPDFETVMPMISERVWTAEEIVDLAFTHGVRREPWHGMEYSNTGYVLAGMIIARETGATYAAHLRQRIFAPLHLEDIWCGTHEDWPLARTARGYLHAEDGGASQWDIDGASEPMDGVWDATTWFPLSGANAAGDMLATPRDVVRFLTALFDGTILGPRQLWELKDNVNAAHFPGAPVTLHGHGILGLTYGELLVKGHLGQIPGHTSVMGREERSGVTAMLIQNSGAADFDSFFLSGIHEPFAAVLREARRFCR
jgi:D-alanyl-D-alanine carboxypeptidase